MEGGEPRSVCLAGCSPVLGEGDQGSSAGRKAATPHRLLVLSWGPGRRNCCPMASNRRTRRLGASGRVMCRFDFFLFRKGQVSLLSIGLILLTTGPLCDFLGSSIFQILKYLSRGRSAEPSLTWLRWSLHASDSGVSLRGSLNEGGKQPRA